MFKHRSEFALESEEAGGQQGSSSGERNDYQSCRRMFLDYIIYHPHSNPDIVNYFCSLCLVQQWRSRNITACPTSSCTAAGPLTHGLAKELSSMCIISLCVCRSACKHTVLWISAGSPDALKAAVIHGETSARNHLSQSLRIFPF